MPVLHQSSKEPEFPIFKLVALVLGVVFVLVLLFGSFYTVQPGERGVSVTLGKTDEQFKADGFHGKLPLVTSIYKVAIRQQTQHVKSECYSSDLQDLFVDVKILYRIPESQVVKVFRDYQGDPFDTLIAPRINEALKEVTATETAEHVVKNRETLKNKALEISRQKVGSLLVIEDLVVENIALTKQLSDAIEQKMIQEQQVAKAKFKMQQAEVDAKTAIVKANGEAEAIRVRANALAQNPHIIELMIAEKWNGISPTTILSNGSGANVVFPVK